MTTFDLRESGVRELNDYLHREERSSRTMEVIHPDGCHNVAVGAMHPDHVDIQGHVGYYCAGMNQQASITVHGNAGPGLAENMMGGEIRVRGNASQYCGATAHGGLLVVEGNAAARCGISLKGAHIVVGGSIGHMSAFMAQSGVLVVCGDVGGALGDSIYEARIYVHGQVESLGADCVEKEMRDEHTQELAALLARSGMNPDLAGFRRYGSARQLYQFQIDNVSVY